MNFSISSNTIRFAYESRCVFEITCRSVQSSITIAVTEGIFTTKYRGSGNSFNFDKNSTKNHISFFVLSSFYGRPTVSFYFANTMIFNNTVEINHISLFYPGNSLYTIREEEDHQFSSVILDHKNLQTFFISENVISSSKLEFSHGRYFNVLENIDNKADNYLKESKPKCVNDDSYIHMFIAPPDGNPYLFFTDVINPLANLLRDEGNALTMVYYDKSNQYFDFLSKFQNVRLFDANKNCQKFSELRIRAKPSNDFTNTRNAFGEFNIENKVIFLVESKNISYTKEISQSVCVECVDEVLTYPQDFNVISTAIHGSRALFVDNVNNAGYMALLNENSVFGLLTKDEPQNDKWVKEMANDLKLKYVWKNYTQEII
ncbi:hypothetical protein GPJ56_006712 [Histomonas meleagridis]|uniref:uncharacterized protein n=1 Tax=Histomonas meleagridis TaxID=135588 RepID=UPI00355A5C1C|nr:hypothetical protein GPJ56_006712 [Histomonas meleagridis]KAH0806457.1 hypothetical protein GO595_000619 [Histomonas meleagridis]